MDKSADEMEAWIVEHIVAKLDPSWPPAHSRAINDVIWSACHAHANAA
ncbi:hypothetical protein [Duganella vulcania]|uniref:Uncharacterized protein n=1 Tax=Duganella vulcania TaxID=2692166 RepID=A0A845GIK7_9BURK|nr:hypothetical protein [Duganella vulcania]MYM92597.1 hypothetical protein [Duganella vulcania]